MFSSYTHSQMIANAMSKGPWLGVTGFPEFKSCRAGNCRLTWLQWEGQKEVCAEEAMPEAGLEGMGKNFQGNRGVEKAFQRHQEG